MLTIIFDSEIFKQIDVSRTEVLEIILSRNNFIKNYYRTYSTGLDKSIGNQIISLPEIAKPNLDIETIYKELQFKPKNDSQEQFIYAIFEFARHSEENVNYCHNCIFVTENPIYFEKYLPGGTKNQCLRYFIPNLILTNLNNVSELIGYYEIKNDYYWLNGQEMELKTDWYNTAVILLIPEVSQMHGTISCINSEISILLRSLIFRFKKLIYGINMLGINHYFDNRKIEPIDTQKATAGFNKLEQNVYDYKDLIGFIDPDNHFIQFYHTEYIIPQVTGIFDNLALLSNKYYNLGFYGQKTSLSNDNGEDFLKALDTANHSLKCHIDTYRNFINLVYSLREDVIHKHGLEESVIPLVPNWNCFIKIEKHVEAYIENCGNSKHIYKYISNWGMFTRNGEILLDPFFFSKNLLTSIISFTNEFIQLVK